MIDEELVRLNYANMPDGQLVQTVQKEGMQLAPRTLAIIREEFLKRALDLSPFGQLDQKKEEIRLDQVERDKESIRADSSKAVWHYVFSELETGTSYTGIARGLKERGLEDEDCNAIILDIPAQLHEAINNKDTQMIGGILSFVLGAGVTLFSLANATMNGGGYYIIAYGAVLAGPAVFFRSLSAKKKLKQMQKHIEPSRAFGTDEV